MVGQQVCLDNGNERAMRGLVEIEADAILLLPQAL